MRLLQRALRRSGLPLAYSQGFNPRLRLNLALPLPLGVTAAREFGELHLKETVDLNLVAEGLSAQLPAGLRILELIEVAADSPPLAALVVAALYRARLQPFDGKLNAITQLESAVNKLLSAGEILMPKSSKKKKPVTYTNIRPYIFELRLDPDRQPEAELIMLLKAGSQGGLSPFFLLQKLIDAEPELGNVRWQWSVDRELLFMSSNGGLVPLS